MWWAFTSVCMSNIKTRGRVLLVCFSCFKKLIFDCLMLLVCCDLACRCSCWAPWLDYLSALVIISIVLFRKSPSIFYSSRYYRASWKLASQIRHPLVYGFACFCRETLALKPVPRPILTRRFWDNIFLDQNAQSCYCFCCVWKVVIMSEGWFV